MSSSLVFITTEFDSNGAKVIKDDGTWPTDLLCFDLVSSYGDYLNGGGVTATGNVTTLTTACDKITTDENGTAFATGDTLTLMWRTQLGGVFGESAVPTIETIYERLRDIEYVLMTIHIWLFLRSFQTAN
mmetsp:Transcript_26456/g.35255  ORF Transcript_26456/g.35255 Transcript_26456/m.35255 type:complete len:130 (+) Transcript_26456:114-503(+)